MRIQFRARGWLLAAATIVLPLCSEALLAQSGTWTTKAPLPVARGYASGGVIDGIVYVAGGLEDNGTFSRKLEAYDPATNTWTAKAPMPTGHPLPGTAVVDGKLYVIGGGALGLALGTVEAYDPKSNTWSTKAAMPTPRYGLAAVAVNGSIYAVGGTLLGSPAHLSSAVEAYDPVTNTWTSKAPLRTPRDQLAVGAVDGILYAAGGFGQDPETGLSNGAWATVEAYDPKTDSWTTRAAMPTARAGLAIITVKGMLYAVGGARASSSRPGILAFSTVEAYNPKTNSWVSAPSMPTPRWGLAAAAVDGTLFAIGGKGGPDAEAGTYLSLAANEAFTPFLSVTIEIRPGDPNHTINLKSNGKIDVAILSSATFDATTVDPKTVTFAGSSAATLGNGAAMSSVADVNGDHRLDLLLHFRTKDLQLSKTDTQAVLQGRTYSGQLIQGAGAITIVP